VRDTVNGRLGRDTGTSEAHGRESGEPVSIDDHCNEAVIGGEESGF
jgi:hypothetical protein